MWVRILAFRPSLQMASQSRRDCSEAAGDVSSRYSTPNLSRALAMAILVSVSKKALENYSPSVRSYISRREVPGTTNIGTSKSTLDDFEVGHVVQKVGCPRCIWVTALLRRLSIDPIGVSAVGRMTAIEAVGRGLNCNHVLSIVGRHIVAWVRAHL